MPGYLTKLAKEFGLENAKPTATSLPIDVVDKKNDGPVDHDRRELFQRMVGGLQWCAQQCLPWISKGVHQLSRHTPNPSEEHIKLAEHCIRHTQKDITLWSRFPRFEQGPRVSMGTQIQTCELLRRKSGWGLGVRTLTWMHCDPVQRRPDYDEGTQTDKGCPRYGAQRDAKSMSPRTSSNVLY